MRRPSLSPALALISVILAGCGGGEEGSTGPTYADSASTAAATQFATRAAGVTALAARGLNFSVPSDNDYGAFFSRRGPSGAPAFIDGECVQKIRGLGDGGVGVDADENGIADDYYWSSTCTLVDDTSDPDTVRTYRQFAEGWIRQDPVALHGYAASITIRNRMTDSYGNETTDGYSTSETLALRSNAGTYGYRYSEWETVKTDGVFSSSELGRADTIGFTPSGTITLGAPLPSGTLTLQGRDHTLDSEGANLSFTLSTTTPLAYDAACFAADSLPPFTAGAIKGKLNNEAAQASFTSTFSACGTPPVVVVTGAYAGPPSIVARH